MTSKKDHAVEVPRHVLYVVFSHRFDSLMGMACPKIRCRSVPVKCLRLTYGILAVFFPSKNPDSLNGRTSEKSDLFHSRDRPIETYRDHHSWKG
jgi:hypothetical protein